MVEYNNVNIKLIGTQLKKTENCCQKQNRNDFKYEFKSVLCKWSGSWIITDNKTKKRS